MDGEPDLVTSERRFNEMGEEIYVLEQPDEDRNRKPDQFLEIVYSEDRSYVRESWERVDLNFDGVLDRLIRRMEYSGPTDTSTFDEISHDYDDDGAIDLIPRLVRSSANGDLIENVERNDFDGDGKIDVFSRQLYDQAGRLVSSVDERDENDDGTVDDERIREWTYDSEGRWLTRLESERNATTNYRELTTNEYVGEQVTLNMRQIDYQADGTFDFVSNRTERLPDGRLLLIERRDDSNQDGVAETYQIETWQYNEDSVLQQHDEQDLGDFDRDGNLDFQTVVEIFDASGQRTSYVETLDYGNDGVSDFAAEIVSTYSAEGVQLTFRSEVDYDGDGTTDLIRVETERDELGRLLLNVSRTDRNRNGVPESAEREVNVYDENGRTFTREEFNGRVDGNPWRVRVETYDSEGQLLSRVIRVDDDTDGTIDSIDTTSYTFDASGNLVASSEQRDSNGDGNAESSTDFVASFDADGRLVSQEESTTRNGVKTVNASVSGQFDAVADQWVTARTETRNGIPFVVNESRFDASGNVISELNRSDFNRDGVADSIEKIDRAFGEDGNLTFEQVSTGRDLVDGVAAFADVVAIDYWASGAVKQRLEGRDDGFDGTVDRPRRITTNDLAGQQVEFRAFEDEDGDGDIDLIIESVTRFDDGATKTQKTELDVDNDGSIDLVLFEFELDELGREVFSRSQADNDKDGEVDWLSQVRRTYGESGVVLTENTAEGFELDGKPGLDVILTSSEYGPDGQFVRGKSEQDWGNDGTIDFVASVNEPTEFGWREYSADDYNFDGVPDRFNETLLDVNRNAISSTNQEDLDQNGEPDFFLKDTYFVDANGTQLPLTTENTADENGDGIYDIAFLQTNTYRDNGVRESYKVEVDFGNDGTVDLVSEEIEYDDRGNPVRVITRSDNDQDGELDYFREEIYETNQFGQQCRITVRDDRDNDGIPEYLSTEVFFYAGARQVGVARTIDENGDGTPETMTEVEGDFIQAGDALGVASNLLARLDAVGISTEAIQSVVSNLEVNTEISRDRATAGLWGVIEAIELTEGITDVQRQSLLGIAQQAILFTNGRATVGLRADIDGDGAVGFSDFLLLATNFGSEGDTVSRATGDIDGDGVVNFADFLILSQQFGQEE